MKKSRLFSVYIEAQSEFGFKFMEEALEMMVKSLNGFKKHYRASILPTSKAKEVK